MLVYHHRKRAPITTVVPCSFCSYHIWGIGGMRTGCFLIETILQSKWSSSQQICGRNKSRLATPSCIWAVFKKILVKMMHMFMVKLIHFHTSKVIITELIVRVGQEAPVLVLYSLLSSHCLEFWLKTSYYSFFPLSNQPSYWANLVSSEKNVSVGRIAPCDLHQWRETAANISQILKQRLFA